MDSESESDAKTRNQTRIPILIPTRTPVLEPIFAQSVATALSASARRVTEPHATAGRGTQLGPRVASGLCEAALPGRASHRVTVLRQLGLPLRAVWALTSSELPWAVPDGPT